MSYCRFSSDGGKSDVYCYRCIFGDYITNVARNRLGEITPNNLVEPTYAPIGLPYDGLEFNDKTIEEFNNRLLHLRECGYHVPECAVTRIDKEIKEDFDGLSPPL